jgi:hypothetical protein
MSIIKRSVIISLFVLLAFGSFSSTRIFAGEDEELNPTGFVQVVEPVPGCKVPIVPFLGNFSLKPIGKETPEFGIKLAFVFNGEDNNSGTFNVTAKVKMSSENAQETSLCSLIGIKLPGELGILTLNEKNTFDNNADLMTLTQFILGEAGKVAYSVTAHNEYDIQLIYTDKTARSAKLVVDAERVPPEFVGFVTFTEGLNALQAVNFYNPYTSILIKSETREFVKNLATQLLGTVAMPQGAYNLEGTIPLKLNPNSGEAPVTAEFKLDSYSGAPKTLADISFVVVGKKGTEGYFTFSANPENVRKTNVTLDDIFNGSGGNGQFVWEKLQKIAMISEGRVEIPFALEFTHGQDETIPDRTGILVISIPPEKLPETIDPYKALKSIIITSPGRIQTNYHFSVKEGDVYPTFLYRTSFGISTDLIEFSSVSLSIGESESRPASYMVNVVYDAGVIGKKEFPVEIVFKQKEMPVSTTPTVTKPSARMVEGQLKCISINAKTLSKTCISELLGYYAVMPSWCKRDGPYATGNAGEIVLFLKFGKATKRFSAVYDHGELPNLKKLQDLIDRHTIMIMEKDNFQSLSGLFDIGAISVTNPLSAINVKKFSVPEDLKNLQLVLGWGDQKFSYLNLIYDGDDNREECSQEFSFIR